MAQARIQSTKKLMDMVHAIVGNMPPETRFTEEDAAVISQYSDVLQALSDDMIMAFYDTLFGHEPTRQIFKEGERPARMHDFSLWWKQSVSSPFDDEYWMWQSYVGVLHVKRGVKNAMMMSMWSWLLNYVSEAVAPQLSWDDGVQLLRSMRRLCSTCEALIADSYLISYIQSIEAATGFGKKLIDRMVINEIDTLVEQAEGQLSA